LSFHVVIPARYASTRLPGKPLLEIAGRPMIQHVVERACASAATQVLVATDDDRIAAAVTDPRAPGLGIAVMTDPGLPSGTDRVAAVAARRGWGDDAIVVNVQGDEPFLPPSLIDQVARLLARDAAAGIATLATPVESLERFMDPNVVKVVTSGDGAALYFSRSPIPWTRDGAPSGLGSQREFGDALRHVGIYAYRVGVLRRITSLAPSRLELREKLEQLRALQAGVRIVVGTCIETPGPGVDTEQDLEHARARARASARGADSGGGSQ
jgi:3-deoxy-manno-octulosonate cytidylyltransferase (CMP-KDO synthetase)